MHLENGQSSKSLVRDLNFEWQKLQHAHMLLACAICQKNHDSQEKLNLDKNYPKSFKIMAKKTEFG